MTSPHAHLHHHREMVAALEPDVSQYDVTQHLLAFDSVSHLTYGP
jgi:hypothetical protein